MGYRNGGPFGSINNIPELAVVKPGSYRPRKEGHFVSSYTSSFGGGKSGARPLRSAAYSSLSPSGLAFERPLQSTGLGKSRSSASLAAESVPELLLSSREPPAPPKNTLLRSRSSTGLEPAKEVLSPKVVDNEARRRTLELLADPGMRRFAQEVFQQHGPDEGGKLAFEGLMAALRTLHDRLDLPKAEPRRAEKLLKKFDVNGDERLAFEEFFELFKAALRRSAFDRSSMVRREFFVTKRGGDCWAVYERQKELGAGTFGKAYLAKSKSSGEERVVKAVQKSRTAMPLDDIEREILVMRQVDHPHVVRLFEWYEDRSHVYLVLEALKGGTLKDVLLMLQRQRRDVQEAWTRDIMSQSVDAMAYVHSLRLIHKDLKDENIMLLQKDPNFDEPFAVIIDLGIAEMFSLADPSGREIGGTPTTMAPEVWKGTFGPKCDVFSLGCVFYELLSGNFPFMAMSLDARAWLRLHKKGPDWGRARTSGASRELCRQMLSYREAERPSMRECRQHRYFVAAQKDLRAVPAESFGAFAAFCKDLALKRSLLLELAAALPMHRAREVIRLFESIDADASGSLSAPELRHFLTEVGVEEECLAEEIFKTLDVDRDGKLSFSEFAAGALLLFKDLLEERLQDLFRRHDDNANGSLDPAEAKAFLEDVDAAISKGSGAVQGAMQLLMEDAQGGRLTYEQLRRHIAAPPPVPPASSPPSCPATPSTTSRIPTASSKT